MPTDSALPEQAHIRQIRLFFSGGPQVALYGSPSTVADGWIANLAAAEVFAGDFSNLLYEVLIDAQDAHQRAPFLTRFHEQNVRQAPQPSWPKRDSAAQASPDPELDRTALRHLNTARVLATRLAQQARRDNRPEDQQRFLAAAADASIKASELQGDGEAFAQLRKQGLKQLSGARILANRLAQQARSEERSEDQHRWLAAAADAALSAADVQADPETGTLLRKQALKQLSGARILANRLAQQARSEERTEDSLRHVSDAAKSAINAAKVHHDSKVAASL